MNSLYNLRDWFYECDRFLFLAEVHYFKEDVIPSEHTFAHELTSSCLDKMFSSISNLKKDADYRVVSFDTCICKDEILFLKETLDNISSGRWDDMDVECIIKAQKIVHKLANDVNADILENNELRGHPPIYNACKIK
ncbi:hypothetical protein [Methanolobus psychrotolerans]|uniref:hypothetical protein n=1 Tax=Methanolobus psychrotolerans TaxID=1874706 RepID=UPI000B91BEDE|nr:hypothetical protein [Methanolobus psychrotolerans]